jgi:hypothetical protein
MIVYQPNAVEPDSAFVDLGAPEALGGKYWKARPRSRPGLISTRTA